MVRFINLTPHTVKIINSDDEIFPISPSGLLARRRFHQIPCGDLISDSGHRVMTTRLIVGEVENLPAPQEGIVYITSSMVAQAVQRVDVLSPDTSPMGAVRNENGNIIGVRALQHFQ